LAPTAETTPLIDGCPLPEGVVGSLYQLFDVSAMIGFAATIDPGHLAVLVIELSGEQNRFCKVRKGALLAMGSGCIVLW